MQGRHNVVPLDLRECAGRRCARTVDATLRFRQSQDRTCGGDDSTLYDVLKFTNITWPRIVLQRRNHFIRDFRNILAVTLGEPSEEVSDEVRDVLGAFAQRGYPDWEHVQSIEEIGAKGALLNHLFEI